jgi:hypothetical protein
LIKFNGQSIGMLTVKDYRRVDTGTLIENSTIALLIEIVQVITFRLNVENLIDQSKLISFALELDGFCI